MSKYYVNTSKRGDFMSLKTKYLKWVGISILIIFILFVLYRLIGWNWSNRSIYSYTAKSFKT